MSEIILTKDSTPTQIEAYFRGVLALDEQDKVFSVNLEDVWQLVYSEKGKAVRALKENFIENVDFIIIAQNGKNPQAGRPTVDYYLTSSCLEYFVARKVRPVFEVYRRVFHHVAHAIEKQPTMDEELQANIAYADWAFKSLNLNQASRILWTKRIGDSLGLVTDALPQSVNAGTDHPTLHSSTELLKMHGMDMSAQKFNNLLESKGIVKTATRPGKGGKVHSWKVLQPEYDKYGQNVQDPKFQNQTQIKWYDNLFGELLSSLGVSSELSFNI